MDYFIPESLQYALRGVDLVISTVSGREQINLILAAGEGTVRHFVPAEFEGKLWQRPPWDGSTAGASAHALALLQTFENRNLMKYTVFSCGVLMEIFHPLGLGSFDIGFRAGVSHPGSYLLNVPEATAEYAGQNAQGQPPSSICLTSVYDLVHFVVLALELGLDAWPREFTLRGDRLSVQELVETYGIARNGKLAPPCPKLVGRSQTNEFLYLVFLSRSDIQLHRSGLLQRPAFSNLLFPEPGRAESRLLSTAHGHGRRAIRFPRGHTQRDAPEQPHDGFRPHDFRAMARQDLDFS